MPKETLQKIVQQYAREAGFSLSGITAASPIDPAAVSAPSESENSRNSFAHPYPELADFPQWIAEGRAGEMEYLKRRDAEGRFLRSSVQIPFPWVRSVVVCAANYNSDQPYSITSDAADPSARKGWISRYAWSGCRHNFVAEKGNGAAKAAEEDCDTVAAADREGMHRSNESIANPSPQLAATDYHSVMRKRLEHLCATLKSEVGEFESHCFVDTGPLVERVYAKYAGLGWEGKNTCLIHESQGSWFFLGVILTSLELLPAERAQPLPDRCGSCTRCIEACPTDALTPYRMDASRCIAYLTIEKRGPIPEELSAKMGRHVFGCDICQEVCPWNRRAPVTDWPELQPRQELVNPALDWLASLSESEYRRIFRGSPVDRAKYRDFRRNVEIAQKNADRQSCPVP